MEEKVKIIQIKNVVKNFGDTVVLKGVSLDIYDNEFVTLLGPSGCGKTTLLRILGGFIDPSSGEVLFNGEDILKLPPYKRDINTVFQKYALFPHLNVYDNVAFGLNIKKEPKDVIDRKVRRMLKLVNLDEYGKRRITELSGGQQQRIAIARALVNEPSVLLLDEPLGALDLKLRKEMQIELKRIQQEVGITFIFVTHDQEEALTMSDKIVVMKGGEIQQVGTPTEIYNEPENEFVANFIGETNIIEGKIVDNHTVSFEDKKFPCNDAVRFDVGETVDVVIRPEDLDVVPREQGMLKGIVKHQIFKGVHYDTIVETRLGASITVKMHVSEDHPIVSGDEKISANDFFLDTEDVDELTNAPDETRHARLIDLAQAEAWNRYNGESVSIKEIESDIKKEVGKYHVTFKTAAGTHISVEANVVQANSVTNPVFKEKIYAMNFFVKTDDIKDSMALDTDLRTWANASAWSLEDDTEVAISEVRYDFDWENIQPGEYDITFATKGYRYKISTTKALPDETEVGLIFDPEDIHLMEKETIPG
ncbi:MAG: ABC transporter ATP-binding protein [Proteobacteria bacterium]|nr:ABC transporter ATP-binding protein [Pseudomonadota bacterium]